MRILVVEDEDAIAEPLAEGLRREGFEVERVATGADALAADEPDLVLLDLRLPDMNGTEVARHLRRGRITGQIPIVALSASTYAWSGDRLVEEGFDGYLQKPINVRAFPEQVRSYCKRNE